MAQNSLFSRAKEGALALSLLLAIPAMLITQTTYATKAEYLKEENALFDSLRRFLYGVRATPTQQPKKWTDWCSEWSELLEKIPASHKPQFYKPLGDAVKKISRFKTKTAIGLGLKNALNLTNSNTQIPQDIIDRFNEIGADGVLDLIEASLQGKDPVFRK